MRNQWLIVVAISALILWFGTMAVEADITRLNSDQIGTSATNGYVAVTDGDWTTWTDPATIGAIGVAGADTQVQFNDGGVFGADAGMTYSKATDTLVAGIFSATDHIYAAARVQSGTYVQADTYITSASYIHSGSYIDAVGYIQTGNASNAGQLDVYNGGGEAFSIAYPDLAPGIDAGWQLPTAAPIAGQILEVDSIAGNVAVLKYGAKTVDANTQVSLFRGYKSGISIAIADGYINLDPASTTAYAGTGVNDIVGYGLPWAVSIVGISANYLLRDNTDVCTIDIFPREDGANIAAACKLTLAETGAVRDSASVTFTAGTHTVTANQTLGIYIDIIGDTTGPDAVLTDLVVTVYYHYSL